MCCQQIGKKNGIHGTDICIWYIAILKNGDIKCLNSECINRRSNGNDIFFILKELFVKFMNISLDFQQQFSNFSWTSLKTEECAFRRFLKIIWKH